MSKFEYIPLDPLASSSTFFTLQSQLQLRTSLKSLHLKQPSPAKFDAIDSHCFPMVGDGHQPNSRGFIYPL